MESDLTHSGCNKLRNRVASHFVHCQLQKEVRKHNNVLKDSLDLIRE